MNRSPLHEAHARLGARFVDFGNWEMPVRYDSVLAEHRAVRSSAGLFDVTHLGRFQLTGVGARDALRRLLSNDILEIEPGRTQYTLMLNEDGGVVDDMIVWWWGADDFWVLPNAANHARVMAAFAVEPDCEVVDLRTSTVLMALQGPDAPSIFEAILGESPGRFRTARSDLGGGEVSMAGTGYTGERGGELCVSPGVGVQLLEAFLEAGALPCGLGARDTLRLEAGLPLWGADIDESTSPIEAGLGFAVSLDHQFVGRDAVASQLEKGPSRLLKGFVLEGRGIPRHGHALRTPESTGTVTSGNLSPMLDRGIGVGYLSPPPEPDDVGVEVGIRGRWVPGRLVDPPFHKNA
jgi:aminomethyltransferase